MELVYIAGKYTGNSTYEIRNNIRQAELVNEWCWLNGYIAICPHTNTQYLDGLCDYHIWANGYLELLEKCKFDKIILVPGWEYSKGTKEEIIKAKILEIPIYRWFQDWETGEAWLEEYHG